VTLQPPMKWKLSHVHTRDPVQFLKEVWHYAQCARQDAVVTLGRYLEEPASKAYDMVVEKAGLVSWKDAVELFGRLVGTDLHNPEYEATMRLTRGEVRQGKSQTVLEYATVFRNVALAASDIPGWVLCDKFLSGLSVPELQRECMTPLNGGRWDDLQACITHVLTCEPRVLGRLGVRHRHAETVNAVQNSACLNAVRKNDGAEGSSAAQETLNAARPFAKHNHGRNKKHNIKGHAGPSNTLMQRSKGPCHNCGEPGHLKSECPHPPTPPPRKRPYQPPPYAEQYPPAPYAPYPPMEYGYPSRGGMRKYPRGGGGGRGGPRTYAHY